MPRTPIAAPVEVADAAEELVRNRRQTERKLWTEWDSARELRATAGNSAAAVFGLAPVRLRKRCADTPAEAGLGPGVQPAVDTQANTYEQIVNGPMWRAVSWRPSATPLGGEGPGRRVACSA